MEERYEASGIAGTLHRPAEPNGRGLVLTHGAGSNSDAVLLVRLSRGFAEAGFHVLRYDLPFRQARPKGSPFPAQAARDREGVRQAAAAMRAMVAGPVAAGGHSYGGRQTAMAAAEDPGMADALLLLSYPLHPPAKPEQLRTAFFPELRTPTLFVHGTRDGFGSIEELRTHIAAIPARTELLVVERAGHDLKPAAERAREIVDRMLF
jgi:uncharacterized protein